MTFPRRVSAIGLALIATVMATACSSATTTATSSQTPTTRALPSYYSRVGQTITIRDTTGATGTVTLRAVRNDDRHALDVGPGYYVRFAITVTGTSATPKFGFNDTDLEAQYLDNRDQISDQPDYNSLVGHEVSWGFAEYNPTGEIYRVELGKGQRRSGTVTMELQADSLYALWLFGEGDINNANDFSSLKPQAVWMLRTPQ